VIVAAAETRLKAAPELLLPVSKAPHRVIEGVTGHGYSLGMRSSDGRLIIFDGDDTLWRVEELYDAALDRAQEFLRADGFPADEWRIRQRERDLENVRTMGMSRDRFPTSSEQALIDVAKRHEMQVTDSLRSAIRDESRSVFGARAPLMPGAEKTLSSLAPNFELALLTKGDESVQTKRINDSGLVKYFASVTIVAEKNEAVFRSLLRKTGAKRDRSWSVGNSLASDVNPALRIGMNAIWIDAHVWEHERREATAAKAGVVVLERLDQTPEVLLRSLTRPTRAESA